MPTVPIVFLYRSFVFDAPILSSYPRGQWFVQGATRRADGTTETWNWRRFTVAGDVHELSDGPSFGNFTLSIDINTIWPLGYLKDDADPTYFAATLTYPDDWMETSFTFRYRPRAEFSWVTSWQSPGLDGGENVHMVRESELLPTELPHPIECKFEYDPIPTSDTGIQPFNRLLARNYGISSLDVTGDFVVDWGDGHTTRHPFNYTLPACDILEFTDPGATPQATIDVQPALVVVTAPDITTNQTTVYDTGSGHYYAEIAIPRLTHGYETLDNQDYTVWVETTVGNTSKFSFDPRPVANFSIVDADPSDTDVEQMSLDAARSYDLTDTVGLWFWAFERATGAAQPPEPGLYRVYTNPLLERDDLADGPWWVYLRVAVGELTTASDGDTVSVGINDSNAGYDIENDQLSDLRVKQFTIGTTIDIEYDHERLAWWHLYGKDGNIGVKRHLEHEPPALDGVLLDAGSPGALLRAGAKLYVVSKIGTLYESLDEGLAWGEAMAIGADLTLIGAAIEADGSAQYHLYRDGSDELKRIVLRRSTVAAGWEAGEAEAVSGLPETTRRPGNARKSGVSILLVANSDDGPFAATSTDNMLTWVVSA